MDKTENSDRVCVICEESKFLVPDDAPAPCPDDDIDLVPGDDTAPFLGDAPVLVLDGGMVPVSEGNMH